jgi:colanic acid biosynthesis protein WcaH
MEPREWNLDGKPFRSCMDSVEDADYSMILDTVVVACTDVCVLDDKGDILLGFRQQKPLMNVWWTIGGRMFPGETFQQSAARKLRAEVSLKIEPNRFLYVNTYLCLNGERAQEPQNHSCHMLDIMMAVVLSENEIQQIKHNEEYSQVEWWSIAEVINGKIFILPLKNVMQDLRERGLI